jgi:methionine aminopeptidase, type I
MISVKSRSEIELMKKAGELVGIVLNKLEDIVKPGITTIEMDRIAEEMIRAHGAIPSFKGYKGYPGSVDFPGTICASLNDEVVHGFPSLKELKDGDIISIDVGAQLNGFHGDAARTFAVGNVSDEAKRLIEVTRQSFFEGIRNAVVGNRIIDISGGVQDYVEKNGFSVVREFVGHGIGREMHEAPEVPNYRTRNRGPRLEEGMTLAVEPMVNMGGYSIRMLQNRWTVVTQDGSLSAHYENTIAVTDNEPLILTLV